MEIPCDLQRDYDMRCLWFRRSSRFSKSISKPLAVATLQQKRPRTAAYAVSTRPAQ